LSRTQVFVEQRAFGQQTGLRVDSVVNCVNLFTLEQSKVLRELGKFPPNLMAQVDAALKAVFGLT
jgi:mRNA-degrading endonuclease toxin of MazEF toxin-antitoxin module